MKRSETCSWLRLHRLCARFGWIFWMLQSPTCLESCIKCLFSWLLCKIGWFDQSRAHKLLSDLKRGRRRRFGMRRCRLAYVQSKHEETQGNVLMLYVQSDDKGRASIIWGARDGGKSFLMRQPKYCLKLADCLGGGRKVTFCRSRGTDSDYTRSCQPDTVLSRERDLLNGGLMSN